MAHGPNVSGMFYNSSNKHSNSINFTSKLVEGRIWGHLQHLRIGGKNHILLFFWCFSRSINWHYEVTARFTHSHRDYPIQKAIWWLGSQPITHHWTTNHTYNNYTVSLFHSLVTSHQIRQWSCQVALVLPEVGTWMQGWTQRWVLKKQSKNPWRSGCFWGKMVVFNQQNIDIFGNKYGGLLMVQRDRYIYIWWYMIYMVVCRGWCTYLGISK